MSSASVSSLSGRLWLAGMGLFLALAGLLFTWVLWTSWQRAEETRRWVPTPCRIISAQVISERPTRHSNLAHKASLRYSYTFAGQALIGTQIKRVDSVSQHEELARKKLESFPIGQDTTCYVNPAQPDQTVLMHDSRAALYSIWFPLLFVFGGLGIAWNAMRRRTGN